MRYLFYHGPVTDKGARNVEVLLNLAREEGESEATLCLASLGGDVSAGMGLFNFIQMLPIAVHTHASGQCESVAVTLMLAGERRTAEQLSSFSLHAATYSEGPLQGQISPSTDLICQPFREKLGWTDEDIENRFSTKDFRFEPQMAKSLGLIGEIGTPVVTPNDTIIPVNIP